MKTGANAEDYKLEISKTNDCVHKKIFFFWVLEMPRGGGTGKGKIEKEKKICKLTHPPSFSQNPQPFHILAPPNTAPSSKHHSPNFHSFPHYTPLSLSVSSIPILVV